ncbi:11786_t:CDS:2, partial [Racocetra fulgida]
MNALYASPVPTSVPTSESAIEKLTDACGKAEHISRNCRITIFPNPQPNSSQNSTQPTQPVYSSQNPPPPTSTQVPFSGGNRTNEAPENHQQKALQTLLALPASLNSSNHQNDQHIYVSIPQEDVPLFAAESRETHQSKRRRQEEDDLESVAEEALEQLLKKEKAAEKNVTPLSKAVPPKPKLDSTPDSEHFIPLLHTPPNSPSTQPLNALTPASNTETDLTPFPSDPGCSSFAVPFSVRTLFEVQTATQKEIHLPSPNLADLPSLVYFDTESTDSSDDDWYFSDSYSVPKIGKGKFDSDANDIIDEERKQQKIEYKQNKPTSVTCVYDIAENAYLQEKELEAQILRQVEKIYGDLMDARVQATQKLAMSHSAKLEPQNLGPYYIHDVLSY